ncbi:sorting nexin-10B-like isoform X2 [Petromyzon marinus]|uniref:Uncharacterized protein LOC116940937 isoform X2 n=1 Tax=Petromyzon marinus TaxID=7757 RepID=A0AAJ7SYT9_PETMA|nr:uncharacterized protein LOC116940937 isoform X2 [Petromyzon marinus]
MPRAMENAKEEFVEVRVRDPQIQNRNSWHPHVDYEIFLHTNSISFTRKVSCTRRRFREFVWLRKCLEKSTNLEQLPDLPPGNLFFSCYNENDVEMRRQGLQNFLHSAPAAASLWKSHHCNRSSCGSRKRRRRRRMRWLLLGMRRPLARATQMYSPCPHTMAKERNPAAGNMTQRVNRTLGRAHTTIAWSNFEQHHRASRGSQSRKHSA